jgi:hypothetical protein
MAMPRGPDARVGLAEFLTELQTELSKARSRADRRDLEFSVDGVTLEVDVSYTLTESRDDAPTGVKPEFWVVGSATQNASDAAGSAHSQTQHLIVQLTRRPETADADESDHVAPLSLLPPAPLKKPNR